jgi:hypothetical protein
MSRNELRAWAEARNAQRVNEGQALKPYCLDCLSVGMGHCSDPLHCGGVTWPDAEAPEETQR